MAKMKNSESQTTVRKTKHQKLETLQHEYHFKPDMNSGFM